MKTVDKGFVLFLWQLVQEDLTALICFRLKKHFFRINIFIETMKERIFSFMRCLFSSLPAVNLLTKDAKYAAMETGVFSLHRPGRAWGLCC